MAIVHNIEIVCDDIRNVAADLLILKHADGYHGADKAVAEALRLANHVPAGSVVYGQGPGITADEVAFIGVGPLFDFRYREIEAFGAMAIDLLGTHRPDARTVAMTIHGVGYGLDERESLLSMISGMVKAAADRQLAVERFLVVDRDQTRVDRLTNALAEQRAMFVRLEGHAAPGRRHPTSREVHERLSGVDPKQASLQEVMHRLRKARIPAVEETEAFGDTSEEKPKLFVAMPFADEHRDEFDIAFVEAAHSNGFICERLDLEHFTGDVVNEIERRITDARGIIALLNDRNPNVFLEIGYALARDKPIIFVARQGEQIPFDVRNQKRIEYSRIAQLRDLMRAEIRGLTGGGVL